MALLGNGIFGMGGISGMGPRNASMEGLLGNFYDEDAMRSLQMKKGLLGAGIAMLGQEPSPLPINFGQSLAQGLKGGVQGAEQARDEYMGNAMTGRKMQFENEARMWDMEQQAQQREEWKAEDEKKAKIDAFIQQVELKDPRKAGLYKLFPQLIPDIEKKEMFPDESSRYYGNQIPITSDDGSSFGYVVQSRDGGVKPLNPPDGFKFLNPFEKAKMAAEGKGQGEIPGIIVDDYNKNIREKEGAAYETFYVLDQADKLLQRGIQTGAAADYIQSWRSLGAQLGFDVDETILSNTQTYQQFITNVVIPRMAALGGNDSNQELMFMIGSTGGDITKQPEALQATIQLAKQMTLNKINAYKQISDKANDAMALPRKPGINQPSDLKQKYGLE